MIQVHTNFGVKDGFYKRISTSTDHWVWAMNTEEYCLLYFSLSWEEDGKKE